MTDLGCFGLPSTHNARSTACRACPARHGCASSARRVLEIVGGHVDPEVLRGISFDPAAVSRYSVQSPTPPATLINAAPAKVRGRIRRLVERGEHLRMQDLAGRGLNPFNRYADLCLRNMGTRLPSGFTRDEFVQLLVGLGWSKFSAKSHVSNCLALMRGLELIEEESGVIKLNRRIQKVQIEE